MTIPASPYFTTETLAFLSDLKANNNRDWFIANKADYEAVYKMPSKALAEELSERMHAFTGVDHKSKLFRVNRDVRFSKDKTPYNTHIHMSFLPQGSGTASLGWMLGLAPDYFSLGCGVFEMDKGALQAFRERVVADEGNAIASMLASLEGKGVRLNDPEMKRVPAGFDKTHPREALLRRKGLIGWLDLEGPEEALKPDLVERVLARFDVLKPIFDLLNKA